MTDSIVAPTVIAPSKTEVAPNYTPEMCAAIKAAAPLNLEKARALATELGKTYRSVIAKAKSLDVEYISMPAPAKKPAGITKADIVASICVAMEIDGGLAGLEKAPASALSKLLANIS